MGTDCIIKNGTLVGGQCFAVTPEQGTQLAVLALIIAFIGFVGFVAYRNRAHRWAAKEPTVKVAPEEKALSRSELSAKTTEASKAIRPGVPDPEQIKALEGLLAQLAKRPDVAVTATACARRQPLIRPGFPADRRRQTGQTMRLV
jgi:hypothetical protein